MPLSVNATSTRAPTSRAMLHAAWAIASRVDRPGSDGGGA